MHIRTYTHTSISLSHTRTLCVLVVSLSVSLLRHWLYQKPSILFLVLGEVCCAGPVLDLFQNSHITLIIIKHTVP